LLHLNVEPRSGYLYASVSGELTVAAAQDGLRELFATASRHGQPRILIDVSRLQAEWGPQERYEVGAFIASQVERAASLFPEDPRIAIYAVAPLMDPNRFTQRVAVNRGAQVRASDSLQELLSWLAAK
jgi:hypothetical protein